MLGLKVGLALSVLLSVGFGQGSVRPRLPPDSRRVAYNSYSYAQPTDVTEWTSWFNIDHPGGNGDFERLEAIRFYYRERVCARPMAMEVRTTDWVAAADTGEVVHSSLDKGFWCVNKEQPQGRICSNYHVRFQCPPGRGVFATQYIEPKSFVVEYRGVLSLSNCPEDKNDKFIFDFMWNGKRHCIDASKEDGTLGRLVNDDHINPNCTVRRMLVHGGPHLCLFATKAICPGDEITYNYGDSSWPWRSIMPCEELRDPRKIPESELEQEKTSCEEISDLKVPDNEPPQEKTPCEEISDLKVPDNEPPQEKGVLDWSNPGTTGVNPKVGTAKDGTTPCEEISDLKVPDNEPPQEKSYWSDWSEWGPCSTSACDDVGIQTRHRKCLSSQPMPLLLVPACQGHHTDRRECSTPPCTAKWGPWGRWGACSVSCGGGRRVRRRTCVKDSPTVQCAGRPAEMQKCGKIPCPVKCQMSCSDGRPNEDCSRCVCRGHVLHGEVHSVTGVPVSGAWVALPDQPKVILARTDSKGHFQLPGVCSTSSALVTIRKDKFAPVTVSATSNTTGTSWVKAVLKTAEKPYIVKHPEDKVRYEGGRVLLCCKATGSPMPDKYYWYHNGTLLDRKVYKYEEDLVLRDLKPEQSGHYYCKTSSAAGSIKSSPALLTVILKGSPACNSTPEPHLIRMPVDCVQPGTDSTFYNAGRCPQNKCAGSLDYDLRCRDGAGFCCAVQTMETRTIDCGSYSLPIKTVTRCSCQKCVEPTLLVRGRVVSADNNEPLRFGHIYIGKERVGTTGFQGDFTLHVTPDTQRLVVNFADPSQKFIDSPKVFIFDRKGGSIYHDVKVMRKQTPIDLNAGESNSIDLGEIKGEDPIGQLVFPANSFHKDNGDVYEGTVKASVTFIDPRNITTAAATPGDLNFVSDEGDMLPLRTYGMFSVDFRDESNREVLGAGGVQVLLDTQHVKMQEHIPKMKLWSLNPETGVWEEESDFSYTTTTSGRSKREERTFLIGNMEIRERRLFNLDVPENRRCYVKVRAYMSDKFLQTEQLEGVVISLINLEPKPGFNANPRAWGRFDSVITGANGACLPAFCDARTPDAYTAYVTAMMGGEELEAAPSSPKMNPNIIGVSQPYLSKLNYQRSDHDDPDLKKTAFKINLAKPNQNNFDETNGPIYPYQSLLACENAPFDANHFRFFRVEKDKYEYNVVPFEENDLTTWTGDYLSWWPNPQEFRACYIKVRINGQKEVMIRSRNLGGTHRETMGKLYGIRDIRSTRDMREANTSAACVEFKCSGMLFDQAAVDRSLITVLPQANCRRTSTNSLLQEYLIKHPPTAQNNETHGFTMLAPVDPLGHNYGIYTVTDQNPRVAKEIAIGRCFDGTSDGFSREMKAETGIALTFHCPERKINRESLFQRLQTNPGQTLAQMARDMREMEGVQVQRSRVVAYPSEQQGRTQSRRVSSTSRRRMNFRSSQRQ